MRTADIELLGEAPYESAEGRAALLLTLVPALTNVLVRRPVTILSPAGRKRCSVAPCLAVMLQTLDIVLTWSVLWLQELTLHARHLPFPVRYLDCSLVYGNNWNKHLIVF